MKPKSTSSADKVRPEPKSSYNGTHRNQDMRVAIISDTLADNKWTTGNRLAYLCGCHRRSIVRDIKHMREDLLLPIVEDHVKGYSYSGEVDVVPNAFMSEGLLFNLVMSWKSSALFRTKSQKSANKRFLKKISSVFRDKTAFDIEDMDDCLAFSQVMTPKFNPERIDFIWRCAIQRVQLRLEYDTPKNGRTIRTTRKINPYLVLKLPRDWIIFCYCYKRKRVIRMALSRMHNIRVTGETFVRTKRFNLKKWLRGALEIYTGDKMVDVTIYFAPEQAHLIREYDIKCETRRKDLPCGGVELRLRLSSFVDLHAWLGSFGDDAIALSNRKLVQEELAIAKRKVAKLEAVLAGTFKPKAKPVRSQSVSQLK